MGPNVSKLILVSKTLYFARKLTAETNTYVCESPHVFEIQADYLLNGGNVTIIIYKL